MSPDQYNGNTKLHQVNKSYGIFSKAYPQLAELFTGRSTDLRGLSIWQSDSDEWVCALRGFRSDNLPVVVFVSGDTLDELLFSLDKRSRLETAKLDKRAMKEFGLSETGDVKPS